MKHIFISTILLLLDFVLLAQNPNRHFISFSKNDSTIEVKVSDGLYRIKPISLNTLHTTFIPSKNNVPLYSYAVDESSNSIDFEVNESQQEIKLLTKGITATIIKTPFQIKYYSDTSFLFGEKLGFLLKENSQAMELSIEKNEILFGGGARVLGMNRRGNNLQLYNSAHYGYGTHSSLMNYTLPLYISSKKYAVLFDNASAGWLDLDSKKNNTVTYDTENGTINYYVITGSNWYNLVDNYTKLTGRQAMPPRWALGNFSSRFGYHSQAETEKTVQKFIDDSIPVDAVIIDIYWFGKDVKGQMGNLDWYRDSFPEPEKMLSNFEKKGIKTILVTEPFILTTSKRWNEAVEAGAICTDTLGKPYTYDFFFGNTGLIDIFKPEAQNWLWNIYKGLKLQGVDGWWGDLGEPELHPKDLQHFNGSANDVHNAYGHEWAKLIYEGFKKDFPKKRPFILMRAGFAGSQRYGLIPWSGDVSRSWDGLISQPEIALQMGMQGLAYMHSDLGGFADGIEVDNELYIRWLQYGVFQPIFRPHAQEHIPAEPVFHNDTTKTHAKKAIKLRYQLMPYIYNMAYENSQNGTPLMIPLFFEEPNNTDLLTYDEAYLWGKAFLVAPVKKANQKNKKVYLPINSSWIDFYTNIEYQGGKTLNVPLSINYIPVFVKAGSFIPMKPNFYNTKEYNLSEFDLHYYHSENITQSEYSFYNDNGETPLDKNIDHEIFLMNSEYNNNTLTFKIEKTVFGKELLSLNQLNIYVHNISEKPKQIFVNNEKQSTLNWEFAKNQIILNLNEPLQTQICDISIHF